MMDESTFRKLADAVYRSVLARLDREDPDEVEAELQAGVVRIRLGHGHAEGGKVFILNHQAPLRELWYAAGDRAWHCQLQEGRWVDPVHGGDLQDLLGETVSAELGRPIRFELPRV